MSERATTTQNIICEQDRCQKCGEFWWGDSECLLCGCWLDEHDEFASDHEPIPGHGHEAHAPCYAAYWLALPPVRRGRGGRS